MTALVERTAPTATADLVAAFSSNGYLILHGVLAPADVDACAEALAELPRSRPDLSVPGTAAARVRFEAMIKLTRLGGEIEAVARIALNSDVGAVLGQVFGGAPVARYTRLLAQSPGALPPNAERRGTPHLHNFGMATRPSGGRAIVWTPVDDVLPDAGPMWILPGSHREFDSFPDRLLDASPRAREQLHRMWAEGASAEDWLTWHSELGDRSMTMLADWMDETDAVALPIILRRGDVLIFSNDLLHGTLPAKDPTLARRIMFTHYHAYGRQLWEIGDAVGSDVNPAGPRLYERSQEETFGSALIDPGAFGRFYESMRGFFDEAPVAGR